jgi:hypothetical protein
MSWIFRVYNDYYKDEPMPPRKKWKIKDIKKKFNSCKDAVDFINTGADIGEADAKILPKLGKPTINPQSDGSFIAEVKVDWFLDPSSVISLPIWTWGRNMTKGDKAAFVDFRGNLQAHEEGHMKIAEDYAKEITGITIKALGATKTKALKELQSELNKYQQEAQNTLDELTIAYDQKTDHGRKQSEVGGEDVRLDCPTGYKFSDLTITVQWVLDGEIIDTLTYIYSGHVCGNPFKTKWKIKRTISNSAGTISDENTEALFLHDGEPPELYGSFYFLPGAHPQVKLIDQLPLFGYLPKAPRIAIAPAEEDTNCP